MPMQTVLVTGADKGIGRALCVELNRRGENVIAACLGDSPELRSLGVRVEPGIDVTADAAVAGLAKRMGSTRLNVLINNAGVLGVDELGRISFDDMRRQFEINTFGPLRVTQALLPCLAHGAKVGIITSRFGSIGDNHSGGFYGYRMSKAAANMLGANLAHDLRSRGVAVILLHPGQVRTDQAKWTPGPMIEPEDAANRLLVLIDELTLETTGTFRHGDGSVLPW